MCRIAQLVICLVCLPWHGFSASAESPAMAQYGDSSGSVERSCPVWQFSDPKGKLPAIKIFAQAWPDGRIDLAISQPNENQVITRLSLQGATAHEGCDFVSLHAIPGGDWGWHIAWSSRQQAAAFYARLDAQAWVSSPPKRFSSPVKDGQHPAPPQQVRLILSPQDLHLQLAPSQASFVSDDEGRTWQVWQE